MNQYPGGVLGSKFEKSRDCNRNATMCLACTVGYDSEANFTRAFKREQVCERCALR
jgi:AraC-like DNA-binding protein